MRQEFRCAKTLLPALVLVGTCACGEERRAAAPPVQQEVKPPMTIKITSTAFKEGERIPREHTGDGKDLSPALAWEEVPEKTRQLALIMDDPDAPTPEPWVHWVLYQLAADVRALPAGLPRDASLAKPIAALQGKNSWGTTGYRGPAPPPGHGTHHYHFTLYALDTPLSLKPGADKKALLQAMRGHVLATGELVGTYQR